MLRIAVLITCHNRRAKTLACLNALRAAGLGQQEVALHVFLTDDGSTDGTSEAVAHLDLPLTVVRGSGTLYWNRGMVLAWDTAIKSGGNFDDFLLLNDDTVLDATALETLLETKTTYSGRAVIVGAVRDPETGSLSYGGVRRLSRWHPGKTIMVRESKIAQEVDTFNGNCVLVPSAVYDQVGMLDPVFTHGMGDFDYGLRVGYAGLAVVVAPGTVGTCRRNDTTGTWRDRTLGLRRRLDLLAGPKGLPRREWFEYLRRHGALCPRLLAWLPVLSLLVERRLPGYHAQSGEA